MEAVEDVWTEGGYEISTSWVLIPLVFSSINSSYIVGVSLTNDRVCFYDQVGGEDKTAALGVEGKDHPFFPDTVENLSYAWRVPVLRGALQRALSNEVRVDINGGSLLREGNTIAFLAYCGGTRSISVREVELLLAWL